MEKTFGGGGSQTWMNESINLLFKYYWKVLQADWPVGGHEDEGVDGDVGRADDECLVEFAPNHKDF